MVKHDKDNTKVRVVYNASARSGAGTSLNDALLVGPKFNQRILDILLRFRSFQTALVADIKKAFLMVGVDEGDQDVLCFLRLKDRKQEPSEVQVLKFKRVVFGVASNPFLLNATIKHHLEGYRTSQPQLVDRSRKRLMLMMSSLEKQAREKPSACMRKQRLYSSKAVST